jgi:hypothetical protein
VLVIAHLVTYVPLHMFLVLRMARLPTWPILKVLALYYAGMIIPSTLWQVILSTIFGVWSFYSYIRATTFWLGPHIFLAGVMHVVACMAGYVVGSGTQTQLLKEASQADKLRSDRNKQSGHPLRCGTLEQSKQILELYRQAVEGNVLQLSSCQHLAKHAYSVMHDWLESQQQRRHVSRKGGQSYATVSLDGAKYGL